MLGGTRDAAMLAIVNRLFRAGLPAVNAARSEYGLAPLSSFYEQALVAERVLVLTSPAFDYAATSVPANVRYVGPIWMIQIGHDVDIPWAEADKRPLVLVGFSSTYQNMGPLCGRWSRHSRLCRCAPS